MNPNSATSSSSQVGHKRKKLPACDYCKARRVLCHPQSDGSSCPRCIEKGVKCETTPVVRRRRRTKAECQEARRKAANKQESTRTLALIPKDVSENNAPTMNASDVERLSTLQLLDYMQRRVGPQYSEGLAAERGISLPPSLVKELFENFRLLPQYHHPVMPILDLESLLLVSGWQLSALPPSARVLAHCVLAITSFISTNVLIIGPGVSIPPTIADLSAARRPLKNALVPDLREIGVRRKPICQQLHAEAVRLANLYGTTTTTSKENAASCLLLDFLEHQSLGQGGTTYAASLAYQIRVLAEAPDSRILRPDFNAIRASMNHAAFMMCDALSALSSGKCPSFTSHDQLLVQGEDPPPLEHILEEMSSESCTMVRLIVAMRPIFDHITRLAREISEQLTGVHARRFPLNETALSTHMKSLNVVFKICTKSYERINQFDFVLVDRHHADFLRCFSSYLSLALGCLIIPVHDLLKSRLQEPCGSYFTSSLTDIVIGEQQSKAILEPHYHHFRGCAQKAALEVSKAIRETPKIHTLTYTQHNSLHLWTKFLLEEVDVTEITSEERTESLTRFRDALKLNGFCWEDRSGLVEAIDAEMLPTISSQLSEITSTSSPEEYFNLASERDNEAAQVSQFESDSALSLALSLSWGVELPPDLDE